MRLIVYFDGQFWTGLIERYVNNELHVNRHIFGSEPKDGDIEDFVKYDLIKLFNKTTACNSTGNIEAKKINPKRLKKLAAKEVNRHPVSTKAQAALQQALEENKKEKAHVDKERKLEHENYKRMIAVEKRKQKHRGH